MIVFRRSNLAQSTVAHLYIYTDDAGLYFTTSKMVGTSKRGGRTVSSSARATSMRKDRSAMLDGDSKEDKMMSANGVMSPSSYLDPLVLSRGMTGRVLGARIPELEALSREEIESDLAQINKYYAASVQYTQQLYMFRNRLQGMSTETVTSSQSNKHGTVSNESSVRRGDEVAMKGYGKRLSRTTSKLDPEEEKRNQTLKKRIAQSEAKREVLESQYVSLRAHYVHECKNLETMKSNAVGTFKLLQSLVRSKATVVALQRAKVSLANDIMKFIAKKKLDSSKSMEVEDCKSELFTLKELWMTVENKLQEAILDCKDKMENINGALVKASHHLDPTSIDNIEHGENLVNKPKTRGSSSAESIRVCWDASVISGTPSGVKLLLSPLSRAPDRAAAVAYGCLFDSKSDDLTWLEENLPQSLKALKESNPCEINILKSLQDEVEELDKNIEQAKSNNARMNSELQQRRKQSDKVCARMALLRTETEAVVMRHNVILETPEARARADALMESDKNEEGIASTGDETESNNTEVPDENESADNINDGDSSNEGEERLSQDDSDEDHRSTLDTIQGMESANNSDVSDTDAENDGVDGDDIDVADEQSLEGGDESTDDNDEGNRNHNFRGGRTRIQVRLTRNNMSNEKPDEIIENSEELCNGGNRQKRDSDFLSSDDMSSSLNKRARRRQS